MMVRRISGALGVWVLLGLLGCEKAPDADRKAAVAAMHASLEKEMQVRGKAPPRLDATEIAPSGNAADSLKGVEFSVRPCDRDYDWDGDKEKRIGRRTLAWDESGVLSVGYVVFENCGMGFGAGENTLAGASLTLTYGKRSDPNVRAACNCGFQLNWRIRGLERKEYGVSVYQSWTREAPRASPQ